MSGNAHQRRVSLRRALREARRVKADFDRLQAWFKANMQAISGGNCEQCKIGRVRRILFAPPESGRACDLCGWQPAGEPPAYSPRCYVPERYAPTGPAAPAASPASDAGTSRG